MTTKAYRYRIYPNCKQKQKLSMFFGCSRKLYNLYLEWWKNEYALAKNEGRTMENIPNYTFFTKQKQYGYLRDCDSVIMATTKLHFYNAIKDYFKSKNGQRKGRKVGFPQFKKKGVSKDSYTTYNNANAVILDENSKHIRLPKIGFVKIVLHRPFDGRIKSVNVSRSKAGNYFVVLTVENDEPETSVNEKRALTDKPSVVGLDMSYSKFVVSSNEKDDAIIKYTRLYRKNEKKLARLQRSMSRKQMVGTGEYFTNKYGKQQEIKRRSNNREKARIRYAKYAEHVANQRTDFVAKSALHFARTYDVIVLEDIDMQAQARTLNFGKSVNDLAFGEFRLWLEHEASKNGCTVIYADKWFASSQTCSDCGYVNKEVKDLSVREWVCPVCGCVHDRDRNAAINLRMYFEKYNTAGTAGIKACGEETSIPVCYTDGQVLPKYPETGRKQETVDYEKVAGLSEARDFSHG